MLGRVMGLPTVVWKEEKTTDSQWAVSDLQPIDNCQAERRRLTVLGM